jgi:hypothetical protein
MANLVNNTNLHALIWQFFFIGCLVYQAHRVLIKRLGEDITSPPEHDLGQFKGLKHF